MSEHGITPGMGELYRKERGVKGSPFNPERIMNSETIHQPRRYRMVFKNGSWQKEDVSPIA